MSKVKIVEPVIPLNYVCAFLASRGMIIANRFGTMAHFEGDLDRNRIGVLESFSCDAGKKFARRFIGVIQVGETKLEIEVYGRHYAPYMNMIAEEMSSQFNIWVSVCDIFEEVRYEDVPSWN